MFKTLPSDSLIVKIPDVRVVRARIAALVRETDLLRQLLRLAERIERERKAERDLPA